MTIEKVKKLISNQLNIAESKITEESRLIEDLGADSLDTVELLMVFENEFKIKIPEDVQEKIATVGDAIQFITDATK